MASNNFTTISTSAPNGTYDVDACLVQQEMTPLKISYIILMALILATSIIGNSLVVISVMMSPILKTRQTYHFAASLACSDMIMAIFQISFRIPVVLQNKTFCFSLTACFVRIIMDFFGNIGSILNLLFISIDRFIAINLPYKYPTLLSHRRCKVIIIAIWTFAGCWSFSGMFEWTTSSKLAIAIMGMCTPLNLYFIKISFFGIYVPVLIVITCCYIRILHVALSQIRKVERVGGNTRSKRKSSSGLRRASLLSKELKATKSIAIVYIAFCMCWLPSCVVQFIIHFDPNYLHRLNPKQWYIMWILISDILPAIITAINPIIYSFSNSYFRQSMVYVWRKYLISAQITDGYTNKNSRASCVSTTALHRASYASTTNMTTIHESPDLESQRGIAML